MTDMNSHPRPPLIALSAPLVADQQGEELGPLRFADDVPDNRRGRPRCPGPLHAHGVTAKLQNDRFQH